jgi:hypothetical protein
MPVADGHEELSWEAELRRAGGRIAFEPRAVVRHRNRPGFRALLRRNYRWAYSAVPAKSRHGSVRFAFVYRSRVLVVLFALPLALASGVWVMGCWMRAGFLEPLLHLPALFAARLAYGVGLAAGGMRQLATGGAEARPRWR